MNRTEGVGAAPDALADPRSWRPQAFGKRGFRDVADPIVEPLWSGLRVLAHVRPGGVTIVDETGAEQRHRALAEAIGGALAADEAVLDGYLTRDAAQTGEGIGGGDGIEAPTPGQVARQMILGGGSSDGRRARDAAIAEAAAHRRDVADVIEVTNGTGVAEGVESPVAGGREPQTVGIVFVAVDLVSLDGEPLLDVPLLERKRLLDAVVVEDDLVRRGIHVREPIDPWVRTWRSLGFRSLAFKAANSRYTPGRANDAWATTPMPAR